MLKIDIKKRMLKFEINISWEIGNELVVLFGPSGAGKTSTINMIAGFVKPDSGKIICEDTIFFDSEKKINIPPQKRKIGYVSQNLSLFPHMTVRQNIEYGIRKEKDEKKVQSLINKMGLFGYENHYPHELSGGQKQRVALARAIIGEPSLLLLDEPFSMLDSKLKSNMRELVLEIKRCLNIPVVLVTHDMSEAIFMSDKIIFYSMGSIKHLSHKYDFEESLIDNLEALEMPLKKSELLITGGRI